MADVADEAVLDVPELDRDRLLELLEEMIDGAPDKDLPFLADVLANTTVEELAQFLFDTQPATPEELHLWIENFIGIHIPDSQVCPDHIAPFEFIEKCFFEDPDWLTVFLLANRGGGKTLGVAVLDVLEMKFKRCGIVSIGAIQEQARKAGRYVDQVLDRAEFSGDIRSLGTTRKILHSGGTLQVIPCTMSQCNGPHEPKVNIDEVELAGPAALEEAKSIPTTDIHGNRAALRMFSTRKFAFGNVQKEIDSALEKGVKVVAYCYKEITETCPDERSGTKPVTVWVNRDDLDWQQDEEFRTLPPETQRDYEAFDVYDGCLECPLAATCRGDLKGANGWMTIEDVIRAFRSMSVEMWLAQWECRKPNPKGKIYKHFADERCVTAAITFNRDLPAYWTKDWGYSDPDVTLLVQQQGERICVLDEYYITERDTNEIKQYLNEVWIPKYGQPYRVLAPPDGAKECRIFGRLVLGIPNDRRYLVIKKGAPVLEGIDEVRKVVRPIDGPRTLLYVHPRCRQFINEMSYYHYKLDTAGEPTETPDHDYSHGPDALRYFVWNVIKGFKPQFV